MFYKVKNNYNNCVKNCAPGGNDSEGPGHSKKLKSNQSLFFLDIVLK